MFVFYDAGRVTSPVSPSHADWLRGVGVGLGAGGLRVEFGFRANDIPDSRQILVRSLADLLMRTPPARGLSSTAVMALGFAAPAAALETRLTELRVAGGSIRASLEIREMFPAKFQTVLEEGAAIHLRLQIELWEDRPVWDKLAQPAVVSVFRIVLDPSTRMVRVADSYGEVSRQAAWQEPLTLRPDLGRADALSDGARVLRARAGDARARSPRRKPRRRARRSSATTKAPSASRPWARCCFARCCR